MNVQKIKELKEHANNCPNDAESALILLRELCSAIVAQPDEAKTRAVRVAQFLRSEGFSIRKIMRLLNYKSPRSIQCLLMEKEVNAKINEVDNARKRFIFPPEAFANSRRRRVH